MRIMSSRIQLENRPLVTSATGRSVPYVFQIFAHLYFILGGFGITLRYIVRKLLCLAPADSKKERLRLHRHTTRYIRLLEGNGILEVTFTGFEEARTWRRTVIAPNHPSIFDAILLMSRVPGLDCVMNSRLLRDPVMAGATHLCNFVRNDSPLSMVRDCRDRLSEGHNILVFPEGTRSTGHPVGPFHHGYASAAARAGAVIRTVLIECDTDYFGRSFSFFRPARCPMRFRVTTGDIFQPAPDDDPRAISAEIEKYFRANLFRDASGVRRCTS